MALLQKNTRYLEHERLISLVNSLSDAVIAIDGRSRIVTYNAAALNLLDSNIDLTDKAVDDVVHIFDDDDKAVPVSTLISTIKAHRELREYSLHYNDGSQANISLSISPVRQGFNEQGGQGFVLLFRDITREKSLEEERDEFISVVSHELRTPIAIAEGNISNSQYVVEHQGSNETISASLASAHDQIVFLADLVNDLATLSRAERGKLELSIAPFNVHALLEQLAQNYQQQAQVKNLSFRLELDPTLELLSNNELYVREIVQNLLTNALKYTDKGQITLKALAIDNGVEFSVSDTGIGISKGDQTRIFHKFFRSEDFRTRQTKGTGLGLYIINKLARLINAKITFESRLNAGSTFTVSVPNVTKAN